MHVYGAQCKNAAGVLVNTRMEAVSKDLPQTDVLGHVEAVDCVKPYGPGSVRQHI